MNFNSFQFLIFFPVVTCLYFVIPGKLKKVWLLLASFYFYSCWSLKYASLILISILITYFAGLIIEKCEKISLKKLAVALSFISNLSILFLFKYFDFLLNNINHVLKIFHAGTVSSPFSLVLPVGISFYTFQALGYTVDVYRKDIKAERNFINYALFVSFVPQLVAGPIERSGHLLTQIQKVGKEKMFDYEKFVKGFISAISLI